MKFEAADKWLRSRLQMPTELNTRGLAQLEGGIRAHAFFSARVAEAHVLDAIREVSDRFSRGELDLATARATVKARLGTRRAPGSKEDHDLTDICSTARLDLILEQNARMAYAVGEYEQGMDPMARRLFPAWRYLPSRAATPRDEHARYANRVWMKDDPIWRRIFPPSDFGCRCSVEEVAADELAETPAERRTDAEHLPAPAKSGYSFDPGEPFSCSLGALSDTEARRAVMEKIRKEVESSDKPLRFRCLAAPPEKGLPRPEAGTVTTDRAELDDYIQDMAARVNNIGHAKMGKIRFKDMMPVGQLSPALMESLGLTGETQVVLEGKNASQGVKHMAKNHPETLTSGEFVNTLTRLLTRKGMETSLSVERGQPYILHVREPGTANLLTLRRLPNGGWTVVSAHDVSVNRPPATVNNYLKNQTTTTIHGA